MNKKRLSIITASTLLLLGACGAQEEPAEDENVMDSQTEVEDTETSDDSNGEMEHDESGEIPVDLERAEDPKYDVDEEVILETDHMTGMEGAEATIVESFDTTAYAISYTPTNGDDPVKDHKWVVQEELEEADEGPFEKGDEVTLKARHMPGMEGATATIDEVEKTTVYMVDYTPTDDDEPVYNHKWVTEEEITKPEEASENESSESSDNDEYVDTNRGIYRNKIEDDEIEIEVDGKNQSFYLTAGAQEDLEYLEMDDEVVFSYYEEDDEYIIDYIEYEDYDRRLRHHRPHHHHQDRNRRHHHNRRRR